MGILPIPRTHKGIYFKSKKVKQTTMKNVLFSLGMLLLTVAAYADCTVLFSTAKGGSMFRLIAFRVSPAAMAADS